MHAFGHLRLIVNRAALDRRGRALLAELQGALERRQVGHDTADVSGHEATHTAARRARADGIGYLVAVGGDGTLNALLNGVGADEGGLSAPGVVLGVVSTGPGGDFARTVGLRLPPERLATRLASEDTMQIDVGVATYRTTTNEPGERLFLNAARVGYGAEVDRIAARLPRRWGRFRHLLAAWGGIRATERQSARIELAHAGRKSELVELCVANGQFTGGGLRVAPRALPDDGRFSVLAFTGAPRQVFTLTTAMFHGRHLPSPDIAEWQSPFAAVEADAALPVSADGELLGTTPARFTLRERALAFKI